MRARTRRDIDQSNAAFVEQVNVRTCTMRQAEERERDECDDDLILKGV